MAPSEAMRRVAAASALAAAGLLSADRAAAGGLLLYEFGTSEVGLAAAGYAARAQDASTAFTNPAGMTRLEGTQAVVGGQLMWLNNRFSIGEGTTPALGSDAGGRAIGSNGFVPGGGAFITHSVSRDLKLGFSVAGNFGSVVSYDDGWVGRYRVQEATLLGVSFVPSIAYQVTDKLAVGAGVNAMYGVLEQKAAINNVLPGIPDGQLRLDDKTWGFGATLGLMYEFSPTARAGLTWNSQVKLDFDTPAHFSGLGPGFSALFARRGLLDARVKVGVRVPQQVMASAFTQLDESWAVMGNVGWQDWSKFGVVELGVENTLNPLGLTASIPFKDTWHVALGAQHQLSPAWKLNFGVAYDSGFQESGNISPILPVNAAWRFGVGGEQQVSQAFKWGVAGELLYGGTLDVAKSSLLPPALGGRGTLIGSYDNTTSVVVSVYGSWTF